MPLVSVIIAAHDSEPWIGEALASVASQSCGPEVFETILVDSGSNDRTVVEAKTAAATLGIGLRVIRMSNEGPSRARNEGWRAAVGEWIQFLDGDDLLHERKLELQLEATDRASREVAAVYSDWVRRPAGAPDENPIRVSPRIGDDAVADLLTSRNFVPFATQLVRQAWLERVGGFDDRLWLIEDVELMLRLAMAGAKFERVETSLPLFTYRERAESLSRHDHSAFIEGCLRNAKLAEDFWRRSGMLTEERREIIADIYLQGARHYAQRNADRFNAIAADIDAMVPGYLPRAPKKLRYASFLLGYRRAEALASVYRRIKAAACGHGAASA